MAACQEPDTVPMEVDDRTPIVAETPPPAISGGTLLVLDDGRTLVADSDRDRVHIVSLSPPRYDGDILFERGAEPGRSVEGSGGLAHVILRGAGELATIDTEAGELLERRDLCTDPRGIDFDAQSSELYVACADGTLVILPEDGEGAERHYLEPDLRDIVIKDDLLLISRLRSAQVLEVSRANFEVLRARTPESAVFTAPTVGWRMIELEYDGIALLHQFSSTDTVRISPPEPGNTDGGDPGPGHEGGGDAPYGGGGFCEPPIVSPGVTTWYTTHTPSSVQMAAPTPVVDLAVSPSTGQYVVASAGALDGTGDIHFSNGDDFCFEGFEAISTPGQPVALAYLPDGRLVVQSREPAALYVYSSSREHELTVELSSSSVFDTGHDLYHRVTDARIACASCHPEATDDGHLWVFEDFGVRRTQSPEVGLEGSAPFHWAGDMGSFRTLSNEVYSHRMGGAMQSPERADAFERWMFSTARPPAGTIVDEGLRTEGEALFAEYGCTSCHSGGRLSNDKTVDFRGKMLQVPSLRRVALRPPFMHDGRADTLRAAVLDMLEVTQPELEYSGHDVDAIETYLRTL